MTETCFVDTNVFVRYLTNDDPRKADAVRKLLIKAAAGKVSLYTSDLVIAELAWVLKSYYEHPVDSIAELLEAVLNTEGLEVENAETLRQGIRIYAEHGIDFIDAVLIAEMRKKGIRKLYSFDKRHMSRFGDISLSEP